MGLLRDILNLHLVLGTLSKATPLLLAALGGLWSEPQASSTSPWRG